MKQYLDIVRHVLENGKEKRPVRRNSDGDWEPVDGGVMTLACPNVLFSHDMKDGFPLLTTKKMAFKTLCVELEGFIKGITDKKWYQERGCKIWNEWANPQQVEREFSRYMSLESNRLDDNDPPRKQQIKKDIQARLDDLGPFYAFQWRNFDKHYQQVDNKWSSWAYAEANGVYKGTDQLANIVETLQKNPMDRRMVCSAWNPNQMNMMALPPCHWGWNVTVIGDELNLFWVQRSCDLMLGVPFNIASYGLLLCLLAEVGGFKRGNLSGMLVDCHIYENQIEAAKEQITREPRPLPKLTILDRHGSYTSYGDFDIFQWQHHHLMLQEYNPHEKLDFGKVVV